MGILRWGGIYSGALVLRWAATRLILPHTQLRLKRPRLGYVGSSLCMSYLEKGLTGTDCSPNTPSHPFTADPNACANSTGTAHPICRYFTKVLPASSHSFWNPWIRAYSLKFRGRVSGTKPRPAVFRLCSQLVPIHHVTLREHSDQRIGYFRRYHVPAQNDLARDNKLRIGNIPEMKRVGCFPRGSAILGLARCAHVSTPVVWAGTTVDDHVDHSR